MKQSIFSVLDLFSKISMQAVAEALVNGGCYNSDATTTITAETGGDYTVVEGCQRSDTGSGDGSGSTDGSTAEGVRPHISTLFPFAANEQSIVYPVSC
jgi:hypothetical protein